MPKTDHTRIASIDIGTNSVLLTIAETPTMTAVYETAQITRIGEDMSQTGRFKPKAMEHTLKVLKDYKEICRKYSVKKIYAVGTAAMRRAANAKKFIETVKNECGIDIEVISGEREAELSLKAVEADFGPNVVVIDIGGGSTEFIFSKKDIISIPLGCVTLHEEFVKSDPISDEDFGRMIRNVVAALCGRLNVVADSPSPLPSPQRGEGEIVLVATAGTATTLAAMKLGLKEYNHSEVHGFKLTINDIERIIEDLKGKTVDERKKIPGLEPKRADVILPGALILKVAMEKLGFKEVTVSDRGVRWGILLCISHCNAGNHITYCSIM